MANNWEDVAKYLLRNRSIREMVDEVMKSLEETEYDTSCHTGKLTETYEHKNKNDKNAKKKPRRLDTRQRKQLLKQYNLRKDVTQETVEEIARELNLSQARVKKWFINRRKRETLRTKRNKMINTTQQNSIDLNDYFTNELKPLKMNYTSMTHRNISLRSNAQSNVGMNCEDLLNEGIEITAVKKFDHKQNYEKTVRGFVVIQDENGICVLHEQ